MKEKPDKKPLKDDNGERAERNFDTPYEPSAEEIASDEDIPPIRWCRICDACEENGVEIAHTCVYKEIENG